jgi:hypothetical protein
MSAMSEWKSPFDSALWGKLLAFGVQIIPRGALAKLYYAAKLTGYDPNVHD